jgi:hypothetical protein
MPAPVITCFLVAAVLIALLNPAIGIVVAIICGIIEFIMPALLT